MRITLAALFVLGCSPTSTAPDASSDAPLGDVTLEDCDCLADCGDGGASACRGDPGVDCSGCFPDPRSGPACTGIDTFAFCARVAD